MPVCATANIISSVLPILSVSRIFSLTLSAPASVLIEYIVSLGSVTVSTLTAVTCPCVLLDILLTTSNVPLYAGLDVLVVSVRVVSICLIRTASLVASASILIYVPLTSVSVSLVTSATMLPVSDHEYPVSVSVTVIIPKSVAVAVDGTFSKLFQSTFASNSPVAPLNTSLVFVASGINVNLPLLSSNPKKPTLAVVSKYLNSIPLSLLSSTVGAVSPPSVNTGSSIVTVVLLTVVTNPLTCKFPPTVNVPEMSVLPVATSTSNTSDPLAPIWKFAPSKRKLASSSNAPAVPAITIRLSVRSLTIALANVASVVTLTLPVTVNVVPLNIKLALSSSAPAVPASVTLPDVRSLTVALANVDSPACNTSSVLSPVTSNVPDILVLPVACATVKLVTPTAS